MFITALLVSPLVTLAAFGNPVVVRDAPVNMPISRRMNLTSPHNLLRHDQARAQALLAAANGENNHRVVNDPVDNQVVSYFATVGVGEPATYYSLLIDTGSSNTWVGSTTPYVKTKTSRQTKNSVSVTYGSGSFSGTEYIDTVTITDKLVIYDQSIGVASSSTGFAGEDGIIGIGPIDLTLGTLSPDTKRLIPTVTDTLFHQGKIAANQIGISFAPTDTTEALNGELTWGGVDHSKYKGEIRYADRATTGSPAGHFWGIAQTIRYGSSTPILSTTIGIVDTGTTLILIATDAYNRYTAATGAVLDATTGLLKLTPSGFASLQSLFFTTNGVTYEFIANAQLWPRALNGALGGSPAGIYLIVGDIGAPSGQGLDFINGYAFLERFYAVFDTTSRRVGFATTSNTFSMIN